MATPIAMRLFRGGVMSAVDGLSRIWLLPGLIFCHVLPEAAM